MAMIFDYSCKHGSISYIKEGNEIFIDSYRGKDTELSIPEEIENLPVTKIGKKAFLGAPELTKVTVPSSVKEIGEYAFAGCTRLKEVILDYKEVHLLKGAFQGCDSLASIKDLHSEHKGADSEKWEDLSYLLVMATGALNAPYLFDLQSDFGEDWFTLWDKRMETIIHTDDSEGFQNMLLCGEEDYGSKETDYDYYRHQKRMGKVRILILRLMHDYGMEERAKELAREYLLNHIKGCNEEETWEVIWKEHGDDKAYYDFLISLGGVTEDNIEGMLLDLGDRHSEMKAHLLKSCEDVRKTEDAFSMFEL